MKARLPAKKEPRKITKYPSIGILEQDVNRPNPIVVLFYEDGKGIGLTGLYQNRHVKDFNMDEFYLYEHEIIISNE